MAVVSTARHTSSEAEDFLRRQVLRIGPIATVDALSTGWILAYPTLGTVSSTSSDKMRCAEQSFHLIRWGSLHTASDKMTPLTGEASGVQAEHNSRNASGSVFTGYKWATMV